VLCVRAINRLAVGAGLPLPGTAQSTHPPRANPNEPHSLRDTADECSMTLPVAEQARPPMYDPDLLEVPYRTINVAYKPTEPCGNIGEFFPTEAEIHSS
jgi:hypothetical protein